MTDNERKAVEKVSKQIAELEGLKSALELGDPSVTISAGVLKFGKYTEQSVRMTEMTLRLADRMLKTKWHALAHLIGEFTDIVGNNYEFVNQDYQFMRIKFSSEFCLFSSCAFKYMFLTEQASIRSNGFTKCDFTGAIFSSKFFQPDLRGIDFKNSNFNDAFLKGANLSDCTLIGTSFNGANLSQTVFSAEYEQYINQFRYKGRPTFI